MKSWLVKFPGGPFPLLAAARSVTSGLVAGCRRLTLPPYVRVRGVLPVGRRQLDFELVDFIPLFVGSLALRYREEFLQTAAGREGFRCIHGSILASFQRRRTAGDRMARARLPQS
jgi:hypothetical protein